MPDTSSASPKSSARPALSLDLVRTPKAPVLAWALRHRAGEAVAAVCAGADIRDADGVFWEGVNPCVFAPRDVVNHHFPLCSGALTEGDDIVAFTQGSTIDRVFLIRRGDIIVISNSLPFALKNAGVELAPRDIGYHWHMGAIRAHRTRLPVKGAEAWMFTNCNIHITRDHAISWRNKPASPPFHSYAEYRRLLDAFVAEIVAATRHPLNKAYTPIATISSGYDSPAAAVLARAAGATHGLTIVDGRGGVDDSGEAIAAALGLEVETLARTAYRDAGLEAERLFYFGGVANDIVFFPWQERLRGALLFSGYKGDMAWERMWPRPLPIWGFDADGATLQEMRLRAGFVHLPPALFGNARTDQLLAITQAEEMRPWTLWTRYDRPIARRIVEEAGVPRHLFGQSKKMVTSTTGIDKSRFIELDELGLSSEFRQALRDHQHRYGGLRLSSAMALHNGVHTLIRAAHRAVHGIKNALSKPKPAGATPAAPPSGPQRFSLKDRVFFELEWILPPRRIYMTPATDLSFAAQVANRLLAADYPDF
ncbi:MAG: hypothetical protein AB7P07_08485 [Hyphomonadaceae bacterium]